VHYSYADIAPNDRGDLSSQGAVYIYLSSSFINTISHPDPSLRLWLSASAADLIIQQPESYQWLGHSLSVQKDPSGGASPLLIVGAPTFHSERSGEEDSAVGRVYVYRISTSSDAISASLLVSLTGCSHGARTGHSVATSSSYLSIGEPYWTPSDSLALDRPRDSLLRSGRVVVSAWSSLLSLSESASSADIRICDLEGLAVELGVAAPQQFRGDAYEGRFGLTMKFRGNEDSLLVGAPLADDGKGRLYEVKLGSGTSQVILSSQAMSRSKGRIGHAIGVDGSDAIYVGAPYSTDSAANEQIGSLYKV
jgi:hypothetical protein